jgi:hypothetical protein
VDEGVAAADAVAESSAERWRFSGGRDSETGSSGGTHVAPSERWRSGWDGEFESPLLQRRVYELSVPEPHVINPRKQLTPAHYVYERRHLPRKGTKEPPPPPP